MGVNVGRDDAEKGLAQETAAFDFWNTYGAVILTRIKDPSFFLSSAVQPLNRKKVPSSTLMDVISSFAAYTNIALSSQRWRDGSVNTNNASATESECVERPNSMATAARARHLLFSSLFFRGR